MATSWTRDAADYLLTPTACPRCDAALISNTCGSCHADLRGELGADLWAASQKAAEALRARQRLIDRLPTVATPTKVPATRTPVAVDAEASPAPVYASAAAPAVDAATPAAPPSTSTSSSQVSVQSVLAIAGAGLFAIAAIVFTFLNPDLTDFTTRRVIIGVVTLFFLAGAWLLSRLRLQFSAEAIGGLGLVFLGLDVWGVSSALEPSVDPLTSIGAGTLVAALAMLGLGVLIRMRTWLWGGLVGLAITPLFFGLTAHTALGTAFGFLGVAVVALAAHELARRLKGRFGASLMAERTTLTTIEMIAGLAVVPSLIGLEVGSPSAAVLVWVGFGLALAIIAALSARHEIAPVWSYLAGLLAAVSIGILPFALQLELADAAWYIALAPVGVGLAIVALAAARRWGAVSRTWLLAGAWTVGIVASVPAVFFAILQLGALGGQGAGRDSFADTTGPVLVALVAAAASCWGLDALEPRRPEAAAPRTVARVIGLLFASLALVTLAAWSELGDFWQAAVGLVGAVGIVALLVRVPALRRAGRGLRAVATVTAHVLLVEAAAITWGPRAPADRRGDRRHRGARRGRAHGRAEVAFPVRGRRLRVRPHRARRGPVDSPESSRSPISRSRPRLRHSSRSSSASPAGRPRDRGTRSSRSRGCRSSSVSDS